MRGKTLNIRLRTQLAGHFKLLSGQAGDLEKTIQSGYGRVFVHAVYRYQSRLTLHLTITNKHTVFGNYGVIPTALLLMK